METAVIGVTQGGHHRDYLMERGTNEHDAELDVPVQERRGNAAATRLFRRVRGFKPGAAPDRYRPAVQ
ncbi:hypothetical protein CI15_25465 [Paraburkholderia monticola]|uniref:Uncharacterized protein n=1 Tax=Paraburkholderia monticola TaxID=1399968 RepID=A0A149PFQ3_9BURK|nr:hypothetical protein CI15_25465 [Paraburkholderia monticola]